jgi:uncharacterized membrane protein YbhN (UPF0104 family)
LDAFAVRRNITMSDLRGTLTEIAIIVAVCEIAPMYSLCTMAVRSIALSPTEAALALTSIALAGVVPAAPGNLGVLQYVAVSVLVPLGAARAQALSLALILQVLSTTTLSLWGAGSLWFLSARTVRVASAPASEPVRAIS